METKPNYLLAGSFVIGLTVSLFLFVLWLSKHNDHQDYSKYTIYFTGSVTGLERGSAVRFRGIPVGSVTDIKLDPVNIERIKVTVRIASDTPVKTNTIATMSYQGITGITYIELIGSTQEAPPLVRQKDEDYPVIASRSSDLTKVIQSAPEMINKFTEVADRATMLLSDQNLAAFSQSLENMRKVTEVISTKSDRIDKLITDTSRAAEKIVNVSEALETQLPQTLTGFEDASEDLAETSRSIKELIHNNRGQVSSSISDFDKLLRETNETMRHLNTLTRGFSANPSSILFSKERKGVEVKP